MKHKYKPGDIFVIENTEIGNLADELLIIIEPTKANFSGVAYKVYNQKFQMFMDRTEVFLDKFYTKVE